MSGGAGRGPGFASRADTVLVGDVFLYEPQLQGSTDVAVLLSQISFEIAAITPVQEFGVTAEDFESWRRVIILLDHIV